MKHLPILLAFFSLNCHFLGKQEDDPVILQPDIVYSNDEYLTQMASAMRHNLTDLENPNFKVIAMPYYPSVIISINRRAQRDNEWSEQEYRNNLDTLLRANVGLYMDWKEGKFVDAKGNYFKDCLQVDSLMFNVTLRNRSWPRFTPDISDIDQRIFLVNDKQKFIRPKYVWGRTASALKMEETFLVMFAFRSGDHHFLQGSRYMYLLITGLERDIQLTFPLSMMR